ncbi:MAG: T9SS type A sorting domain-containing protein [Flavobacteriales bacterium]|nr:T9SS type A sorting domain-containing protein [Flavobacteriales bacterium]
MKKTLLFASLLLAGLSVNAQCTPNTLYTDSVFGVWPDTTADFRSGVLNQFYSDTLNILIPSDAQDISPSYPAITIDSIQLVSVDGLPPGLIISCNSQTPASCSYLTEMLGCGLIEGTPTAIGTFNLTINVLAWFNFFGPQSLPQPFGGYSITISDSSVGVFDVVETGLTNVRNIPNPFSTRTTIEYQVGVPGESRIRVFNLVGEEVWNQRTQTKLGMNKIVFESGDLPAGVYLYKVEAGNTTFTGRMALQR